MSIVAENLRAVLSLDRAAAAIDFEEQWYSWAQVADTVEAVGSLLAPLGRRGDRRIGVMSVNRPSALAAIIAVLSGDDCLVSVNPLLPLDRLAEDVIALKLPVLIGEEANLSAEVLKAARIAGTVVIGMRGVLDGADLAGDLDAYVADRVEVRSPGIIIEMLTSGTTGAPKRISLARGAFIKSYLSALSYEKGRSPDQPVQLRDDVVMLTNPLTHIGGLWGALTCVLDGRRACLVERFSVDGFRRSIVRHRPPVASAVPAALRMILDADVPREDLASLRAIRTGTAPLDPTIVQEFMLRFGVPVLQNYGATEFAGAVAGWTLKDFYEHHEQKLGSVGRFQPGVSGRIVCEESGEEVTLGTEGILEMKARQFNNGDAWLRTTDRAMIDAEGFLYILGRADNAIIRGGFKVHPDDVVGVLEQHEAVREAVVVGLADRRLGQVPVAAIILRRGASQPSSEELSAYVRKRLLPYQVPVEYRFVDDVPRTPSLKPALPGVKAMFDDIHANDV